MRRLTDKSEGRRIGIFEYDWPMFSFIKDLAIKLAEAGYVVDVFQKDPDLELHFTSAAAFNQNSRVRFFNFRNSKVITGRIVRKANGLLARLSWNYRQNPRSFMDSEIVRRSKKIVSQSEYQCLIGVEKKGLVWAGILSRTCKCPLIYYSLELYTEDHPGAKGYSYLRSAEKQYHRLSSATIIQDRLRAKSLLEYNGIGKTELIYFPISVRGDIVESKSNYFCQKYKIDDAKQFLLYFGQIQDERFSTDLVRIANHLQDDMMLVLHGFGEQSYLAHLRSMADASRVILSFDLVPEERILDVISSATIGLALYPNSSSNDRLAAFSSVKVAYYLQCGVPIIAFDSESFRELMNAYRCGELINSIDEIPQKAERILQHYDSYREQAFMAYGQFYDFDRNSKKFLIEFDDFLKKKCGAESRTPEIHSR